MNIYLAGPMRGIPQDNHPAFDRAASDLRAMGHTVFSPAEHDRDAGQPHGITDGKALKKQILWDLERIAEVDAVVLLDGWIKSSGVRLELEMARFVGVPVFTLSEVIL
jgi:nucleoside 2-deoxyribosyltransferase